MSKFSFETDELDVTIRVEDNDIHTFATGLATLVDKSDFVAIDLLSRIVTLMSEWDIIPPQEVDSDEGRFIAAALEIDIARSIGRGEIRCEGTTNGPA